MSLKPLQESFNALNFQKFGEIQRNFIITPDKKFIYLSVPKCGCSSVKVFLRVLYGQPLADAQSNPHSTDKSPFIVLDNEDNVNEMIRFYISNPGTFVFSLIRDPRQRVLSAFLNKFKYADDATRTLFAKQLFNVCKDDEALSLAKDLDFGKFLLNISKCEPLAMNEHWRPMTNQILGLKDHIKLFNLADSNDLFERILKTKSDSKLSKDFRFTPHSTNSKNLLSDYFTEEAEELFRSIYIDDIKLFSAISQQSPQTL